HGLDQLAEEGTILMDGVEALGLFAGHVDLLERHRTEAVLFEHGEDLADQVTANRIGLDDRESALNGHWSGPWSGSETECGLLAVSVEARKTRGCRAAPRLLGHWLDETA